MSASCTAQRCCLPCRAATSGHTQLQTAARFPCGTKLAVSIQQNSSKWDTRHAGVKAPPILPLPFPCLAEQVLFPVAISPCRTKSAQPKARALTSSIALFAAIHFVLGMQLIPPSGGLLSARLIRHWDSAALGFSTCLISANGIQLMATECSPAFHWHLCRSSLPPPTA